MIDGGSRVAGGHHHAQLRLRLRVITKRPVYRRSGSAPKREGRTVGPDDGNLTVTLAPSAMASGGFCRVP
jgi:hypothetical protein